ncbi:PaaX family transcriptional regulator C-terminal domain-containing protein [Streptomyces sp. MNU89]|uniref:PaaX family transcriptional regulator n=1 Tax=Streptomyces sp. MNU89 TaxID=2560025 RepID=UPI0027DFA24B|nr:PaaX family transcriptional regulator C-terminal domain-containing protein [Streptomyces sp. MNU89]
MSPAPGWATAGGTTAVGLPGRAAVRYGPPARRRYPGCRHRWRPGRVAWTRPGRAGPGGRRGRGTCREEKPRGRRGDGAAGAWTAAEAGAPAAAGAGQTARPESFLLALFGDYVLDRGVAVSTGSVIAVLRQLGVGEHATRAAAARMARRGLLRSVRRGRRAYLGLTPHGTAVLRDGRDKLEAEVVDRHWDGRWTLLAFSVPESRRADRHALRTRLGWAGFGPLRSGLWVSTRAADLSDTLARLDLLDHAEVFRAEAALWTDPARIVREAWDLSALAAGYRRFTDRWSGAELGERDGLALRTRLTAEWLLLIRHDPRLPRDLLTEKWPGVRAQELFRTSLPQLLPAADTLAAELLDTTAAG